MENNRKKKAEKESKPKKEINLGLIMPLILLLAVVGSVIGTVITSKFFLQAPVVQVSDNESGSSGVLEEDQVIFPLDEFLVNLAKTEDAKQQYIRIELSLLVAEKEQGEVEKNIALVRDSIINILRQKRAVDILDTDEGYKQLKGQVKDSVNATYGKEVVYDVFVTEMVIQ